MAVLTMTEYPKIVKGGNKFSLIPGVLEYRKGYDIVQISKGKFYLSVMNGPFEIFEGPIEDSVEKAESVGIAKMLKERPALARNVGL